MRNEDNQFGKIQKTELTDDGWLKVKFDGDPFTVYNPLNQYDFWKKLKVDEDGHVICVIENSAIVPPVPPVPPVTEEPDYDFALEFDDDSKALLVNNTDNIIDSTIRGNTSQFTYTTWVYIDDSSASPNESIFYLYDNSSDRVMFVQVQGSGSMFCRIYSDTARDVQWTSPVNSFQRNVWNQVTISYDYTWPNNDYLRVYVNSNKIIPSAVTWGNQKSILTNTTNKSKIILNLSTATGFNGKLDDSSFWNCSFEQSDVDEIYNAGKLKNLGDMTKYEDNCLAWWTMGDIPEDNFDIENSNEWTIHNYKDTDDATTTLLSQNLEEDDRIGGAPKE